jgi:hypothetical protein
MKEGKIEGTTWEGGLDCINYENALHHYNRAQTCSVEMCAGSFG